ncbi:u-box domain protein [Dictyocaulus viviparus]|uniref:U-box domain protein n=1 Tax=Dictyocaulus viviparus TaxID=29172 RepID=A0A0D8Y8E2_DICVI|nr:u-box domain protein [Dictyocaulus viviparus]
MPLNMTRLDETRQQPKTVMTDVSSTKSILMGTADNTLGTKCGTQNEERRCEANLKWKKKLRDYKCVRKRLEIQLRFHKFRRAGANDHPDERNKENSKTTMRRTNFLLCRLMTRHGKNCTAASVYSYHERLRDAKVSGYGTLHARLGADSIKEFDCCSLTLQPCKDPVITPNGYLFDRQAILEYILVQKKEIAKRTKQWEKQMAISAEELKKSQQSDQEHNIRKFAEVAATPVHTGKKVAPNEIIESNPTNPLKRPGSAITVQAPQKVRAIGNEGEISNMKGERSKQLPSFWIPELNPTADTTKLEKPSQKVMCPLSGKPLKMKDLMDVKFTPLPKDDDKPLIAAQTRYMCAVTHDALTNATRKCIVTWDVVERLIKKDWHDPITGDPMTEDDVIELQRGGEEYSLLDKNYFTRKIFGVRKLGTGYAATNEVKAKLIRPQLELQ